MEFPTLGDHCEEASCKILDFLPFRCDGCKKVFCKDHINYIKHTCNSAHLKSKDFQVPLCPLCNQPVPYKRDELPDRAMSAHIDRDCKSDPAEERRRKIFNNKCSLKGCKNKEIIPFLCTGCNRNYCIRHRHETDHECQSIQQTNRTSSASSTTKELNNKRWQFFQKQQPQASSASLAPLRANQQTIQPSSMSDREALDYAIKLSLSENKTSVSQAAVSAPNRPSREETEDEMLARVLAQSELEYNQRNAIEEKKDNCSIN